VGAASSRDQLSAGNSSRLEAAPTTQNFLKLCSFFHCVNPVPDSLPKFKLPAGSRQAAFYNLSLTLTPALIQAIFFICRNIFTLCRVE